jgi:ribosome recycling factor
MVKVSHRMAEEGKVRLRNARRDALEIAKKGNKDKVVTDDDLKRIEKEIQTQTDTWAKEIDKALKTKESELTGN